MNKAKLLTGALAAVTILAFSSCKKDNAGGGAGVSATVGGKSWQSSVVVGAQSSLGSISIDAIQLKKGDTSDFSIVTGENIELNKTKVMEEGQGTVYYTTSTTMYAASTYWGGHGELTITGWDKNAKSISGTFSGVFINMNDSNDSIAVTGGHFNSTYQPD